MSKVILDMGCVQLAINELRRSGKNEIANELVESCEELREHTALAIKSAVTSTVGMMPLLDEGGIRKLKADGVREAKTACAYEDSSNDCFGGEIKVCLNMDLEEYANELERGKL